MLDTVGWGYANGVLDLSPGLRHRLYPGGIMRVYYDTPKGFLTFGVTGADTIVEEFRQALSADGKLFRPLAQTVVQELLEEEMNEAI